MAPYITISTKQEIIEMFKEENDVNIIWIFSLNSERETNIFELIVVYTLLIIATFFTIVCVICVLKSAFPHRNHRCILVFVIISWGELIFSRTLVFYFQITKEPDQKLSQALFWAAVLRYHYMFVGSHSIVCVAFERAMATLFLSDYEKNQRLWVVLIALIFLNFISLGLSLLSIYQLITMKIVFLNSLFITITSIVLVEVVYVFNKYKLKALDKNDGTAFYSLSIRFQVQENVKTLKLLRGFIILVGSFIVMVILTECLPVLLMIPDNWRFWFNLVFDTIVHINPILVVPISFITFNDYKKTFIREYYKIFVPKPKKTERKKSIFSLSQRVSQTTRDGDVYFEMFNKSVKFVK